MSKESGVILTVKVTPKAREDKVVGWDNEILKVRVKAPPEKGEANRAVIRLLSTTFHIPQKNLILLQGGSSPLKRILFEGCTMEYLLINFCVN